LAPRVHGTIELAFIVIAPANHGHNGTVGPHGDKRGL
jgi:hypothetical protein